MASAAAALIALHAFQYLFGALTIGGDVSARFAVASDVANLHVIERFGVVVDIPQECHAIAVMVVLDGYCIVPDLVQGHGSVSFLGDDAFTPFGNASHQHNLTWWMNFQCVFKDSRNTHRGYAL